MLTRVTLAAAIAVAVSLPAFAQSKGAARGRGPRVATPVIKCAADLGKGVTTQRQFCDVIIADKSTDSILVTVPPHRGAAKLMFDLHNRVAVPPESGLPTQAFARNTSIVSVLGPKGELGRGAAVSEFRTVADLYDRLPGGAAGGTKSVAPGPPTSVEVSVPAGVTLVGIVGERLDVLTKLGKQTYETPGRPIAIISNIRVEVTPLK